MLKKQYRLKSRPAFKKALQGRVFYSSRYLAVYAIPHHPNHVGKPPRFGFIVSKKVDKRATRRNRIKRRLREAIRVTLLTPPMIAQVSRYQAIVLIARNASPDATLAELCGQLRHGFGQPGNFQA